MQHIMAANRAQLFRFDRDNIQCMPIEREKLNFVGGMIFIDMHDSADIPGFEPFIRQIDD